MGEGRGGKSGEGTANSEQRTEVMIWGQLKPEQRKGKEKKGKEGRKGGVNTKPGQAL